MMEVKRIAMSVSGRSRAIAAVTLLLILYSVSIAQASPAYPAEIQTHLGLSYVPQCIICHATNLGGTGTATTKFATAMKAAGLTGGSQLTLLDSALDTVGADATGATYIQALKDGRDPNTGTVLSDVPTEKYGCGARIAPGTARPNAALTLALALLGMVLMSRRRER